MEGMCWTLGESSPPSLSLSTRIVSGIPLTSIIWSVAMNLNPSGSSFSCWHFMILKLQRLCVVPSFTLHFSTLGKRERDKYLSCGKPFSEQTVFMPMNVSDSERNFKWGSFSNVTIGSSSRLEPHKIAWWGLKGKHCALVTWWCLQRDTVYKDHDDNPKAVALKYLPQSSHWRNVMTRNESSVRRGSGDWRLPPIVQCFL